jgi:hypothetical protein
VLAPDGGVWSVAQHMDRNQQSRNLGLSTTRNIFTKRRRTTSRK